MSFNIKENNNEQRKQTVFYISITKSILTEIYLL